MKDTLGRVITLVCLGAGAVIATVGGTYLGLVYLFEGLKPERIALLVLGMMCASVGAVLLVLFILRQVWSIKHEHQAPKAQESISAPYRVVQPPQIQSPERTVTIPVYSDRHKARPLGAGIELRSSVDDVEQVIKLSDALRFIELETPSRSEWRGKPTTYGALMRWFQMHGWLLSAAGGGVRWRDGFTPEAARDWLMQYVGEGETLPYSRAVYE